MVSQIFPIEPQLNKANTFDTEALFLNLDLSITNGSMQLLNRHHRVSETRNVNEQFGI